MKHKYILEIYDDSNLIYKVDFIKQNRETKYKIKKSIHNLHPKASEINGKYYKATSEFDVHILEILKVLELNQKDT